MTLFKTVGIFRLVISITAVFILALLSSCVSKKSFKEARLKKIIDLSEKEREIFDKLTEELKSIQANSNMVQCSSTLTPLNFLEIAYNLNTTALQNFKDDNLVKNIRVIVWNCKGSGVSSKELGDAIEKLNPIFAPCKFHFTLCKIDSINYDSRFDANKDLNGLVNRFSEMAKINVYVFNSIIRYSIPNTQGFTCFDGASNYIVLAKQAFHDDYSLSHEIGHFFSLYHINGKFLGDNTDELANGSNCSNSGDDVCDTPASPNLASHITADCKYECNQCADTKFQSFHPDVDNIMSYSPCRKKFTDGQIARMRLAAATIKSYLFDQQDCN